MAKEIFRKKSLERLSTPDRLDQLLRVVKRRSWIPLLALGGILLMTIVWCIVGRVSITVDAIAVLVHPQQVVPIQPSVSGELKELVIGVGSKVKKGDPIGTLSLPELDKQLELERQRLVQSDERAKALQGFNKEQADEEKKYLQRQIRKTRARSNDLKERAEEILQSYEDYNKEQRTKLDKTRGHLRELGTQLQKRLESYEKLGREKLTSADRVLDANQGVVANNLRLAEIEVEMQELKLRMIQAAETRAKQMDLAADLDIQLIQLDLKLSEIEKRRKEALVHETTDRREIERNIERLHNLIDKQGKILADYDGKVLEVTVSKGAMVVAGQRIASLAVDHDSDKPLVALAYFSVADGKKVKIGDPVRVSPVTVQKQRHGSMIGVVEHVSDYPMSADAVVNQVGNREMAQMLVGGQSRVVVRTTLKLGTGHPGPDRKPVYAWTSGGGPTDVEITAGTTASVRVTIEERNPITLLMPALRGWLGLD